MPDTPPRPKTDTTQRSTNTATKDEKDHLSKILLDNLDIGFIQKMYKEFAGKEKKELKRISDKTKRDADKLNLISFPALLLGYRHDTVKRMRENMTKAIKDNIKALEVSALNTRKNGVFGFQSPAISSYAPSQDFVTNPPAFGNYNKTTSSYNDDFKSSFGNAPLKVSIVSLDKDVVGELASRLQPKYKPNSRKSNLSIAGELGGLSRIVKNLALIIPTIAGSLGSLLYAFDNAASSKLAGLASMITRGSLHFLGNRIGKLALKMGGFTGVEEMMKFAPKALGAVAKQFSKKGAIGIFKLLPKLGGKGLLGVVSKTFASTLGKIGLKGLPILGSLFSIGSSIKRFTSGDWIGGILELTSGVAGLFPGIGTGISWAFLGATAIYDLVKTPKEKTNTLKMSSIGNFFVGIKNRLGKFFTNDLKNIPGFNQIFTLGKTLSAFMVGDYKTGFSGLWSITKSLSVPLMGLEYVMNLFSNKEQVVSQTALNSNVSFVKVLHKLFSIESLRQNPFFKWIIDVSKSFYSFIKNPFENARELFKTPLGNIPFVGTIISLFSDANISPVIGTNISSVEELNATDILSTIRDTVIGKLEAAGKFIINSLNFAKDLFLSKFTGFVSGLRDTAEGVADWVEGVWNKIAGDEEMDISEIESPDLNELTTNKSKLKDNIITSNTQLARNNELLEDIKEQLRLLLDGVVNSGDGIVSTLYETSNALNNSLTNSVKRSPIFNGATATSSNINDTGSTISMTGERDPAYKHKTSIWRNINGLQA